MNENENIRQLLKDYGVIATETCHPLYLDFDIFKEKIEVPKELVPEILGLIEKHCFGKEANDIENYF